MRMLQPQVQQVQQQPQQRGLLSSLFSMLSPMLGPVGTIGNAFLNPSPGNASGALTQISEMLKGGENGNSNLPGQPPSQATQTQAGSGTSGGSDSPNSDMGIGPAPTASQEPGTVPIAPVQAGDAEIQPDSAQETGGDIYAEMSVRDLFSLHPDLEQYVRKLG